MSILLSGSGASTRGAFVGTALVEIAKKRKFNYFVGVSYSAIVGVPLALGMYDEIINETLELRHKDFFKVSPMNEKGKFTFAAVSRLAGSLFSPNKIKSFGVQDVKPILQKFITKELFKKYQNGDYAKVYIAAVNADTQNPQVWNVKDKSICYERFLNIVSASARIPVWTQPQLIDGVEYYDGGVTDTNASSLILNLNKDIKELYSVYPRPKDFKGKKAPKRTGILGAITWTIDTMLKDVSKNDAIQERDLCEHKNIKLVQIFPQKYVLSNLYDVDKNKLLELSQMAVKAVNKLIK